MRAFLLLCLVIVGCFVGGALLGYPAYLLVHPLNPEWPFHRIVNRVSMLLLLIGLIWLLRYLRVNNRGSMGYGLPRREFFKQMGIALVTGIAIMTPVVGVLYALGIRVVEPGQLFTAEVLVSLFFKGLLSGLVVAFIEESLLRGAMHSAIQRTSGPWVAVGATAFVYSAVHFINKTRIPHEQVDASSGIDLLSGALSSFADPLAIADSFLALFAVGVLLGLVRIRTGAVAACIGLHAGWVCVIFMTRELTVQNGQSPLSFLVGSYDGVVGYLVLAWTLAMIAIFWKAFNVRPAR